MKSSLARVTLVVLVLATSLTGNGALAATPYTMATGDYSEGFGDIANWTANFAGGIGATYWGSVAVNAAGTIPDGSKTTVATTTFVSGTSGGVQKGSGNIQFLSTGTADNSSSCAIELFLDFTGRNAGNLDFAWAEVANSTGNRAGSIRVYTSTDGTTYTELTGAAVLNVVNNVTTSGTVANVVLPTTFNNSATARIRFYYYNGTGGSTGSRPKISIDNVAVTSTPSSTAAPTVIVTAATSLGTTTATLNANVTADGGAAVTARGFNYNTTGGVTLTDNPTPAGTGTGVFTSNLALLGVNVNYFYRAYATNVNGSALSIETNFWTLAAVPVAPNVNTPTPTNLNVTLGLGDGNPANTVYAIQETNTAKYVQADGSLNTNAIYQVATTWSTVTVSGLNPNTVYIFKVKAQNGAGTDTAFGATTTGTTSIGVVPPAVTTQAATTLTTISAILNGMVTASNGAPLSDRGFFWQVNPGVTLTDNKLSEGGTAVSSFSKPLGSLGVNTVYYYRAYAVNSAGTNLDSSEVSFYTLANPPTVPIVDGITGTTLNLTLGTGDGNPANTVYAIQETNSGFYVQSNGVLGATVVYEDSASWGTKTVSGLSGTTTYAFQVKAQNGSGIDTAFSPVASGTTLVAPVLVAGWDFQTTTSGGTSAAAAPGSPVVYVANVGSGTIYLDGSHGASAWNQTTELNSFSGTAVNAGAGFATSTASPACLALVAGTSQSANGKDIVFAFSMTGRKDLVVSYATQRTGTGFNSQLWEYSTDGTTWNPVQTISSVPAAFATTTLNTITGLDNAPTSYLRLTVSGASSAAGNNRLDNIQLNATLNATAVTTPVITNIQVSGGNVLVDFTAGMTDGVGDFSLVSTTNLTTAFSSVAATVTTSGPGMFRASVPLTASIPAAFYRVKR